MVDHCESVEERLAKMEELIAKKIAQVPVNESLTVEDHDSVSDEKKKDGVEIEIEVEAEGEK